MTRRISEKEVEKFVESFYNYLKQEKGISEETASAHAHQIRFFALHYLIGYEEKSLLEVTGSDIEDYLGNWYIRKVFGSGRSDVRYILVAFKKFYKFLHERGNLEEEELNDILSACDNPQRYIRRFDAYMELDPESETWEGDFRNWFMGEYDEKEIEVNYKQPFELNAQISRAFSAGDLKLSNTSVLNNFRTFLNYISEHNSMKLTAANSFISRKHIFSLNKAMSSPEKFKSTANQPDSGTVHLFYNLSKTLNLFVVSAKNTLEITPRMDTFKLLSPKEQFVVLFDAMWNETSWVKFLPPDSGGRQEYVQEERMNIASALSECEVDEKYPFVEWIKEFCRERGNAEDELDIIMMATNFVYSVFDERIAPALKVFGLLDFEYKKDRDKYLVNRGRGIEWFTITQFGKKIFKTLMG
uniref:Tyrosine recombinase XerC n=1 Tax=Candidatus Methanophagaceae archaeon ANME-1 ERB6 TaxID=2759912 RepID=A0A7G9Z0K6_9EURY|nr:tyrosine recombinase XerC [Methanosarcinales archaeon ANME-1 ERB6]QNO53790.1 tyrosine recombinase XerC [Methanosarcinales archaeon ANME-1 ERB6]